MGELSGEKHIVTLGHNSFPFSYLTAPLVVGHSPNWLILLLYFVSRYKQKILTNALASAPSKFPVHFIGLCITMTCSYLRR